MTANEFLAIHFLSSKDISDPAFNLVSGVEVDKLHSELHQAATLMVFDGKGCEKIDWANYLPNLKPVSVQRLWAKLAVLNILEATSIDLERAMTCAVEVDDGKKQEDA